jgi:hypothetical protein
MDQSYASRLEVHCPDLNAGDSQILKSRCCIEREWGDVEFAEEINQVGQFTIGRNLFQDRQMVGIDQDHLPNSARAASRSA